MVTIKEIANIAGVTTTTVSNVIHGKTNRVSAETERKINQILEDVKYVPNMGLRVLANKTSRIIGVVVNPHKHYEQTIFADPFFGKILGTLELCMHQYNYYMMIYSTESMDDIYKMAEAWNVDGIIGISITEEDHRELNQLLSKPIVTIDLQYQNKPEDEYYNVTLDDFKAAYDVTNRLLDKGHDKIILIANNDNGADYKRWMGCKKAIEDCKGFTGDIRREFISVYRTERYEEYKKYIKLTRQGYILFFASDFYAIEALSVLHENGVRVPEDIGVMGFDDIIYSATTIPKLTTVKQEIEKKAEMALEMLMQRIQGEEIQQKEIFLEASIVIRDSVKNL